MAKGVLYIINIHLLNTPDGRLQGGPKIVSYRTLFYKVVWWHSRCAVHANSSKFLPESTDEKIVKIGQYLAKIRTIGTIAYYFWTILYMSI